MRLYHVMVPCDCTTWLYHAKILPLYHYYGKNGRNHGKNSIMIFYHKKCTVFLLPTDLLWSEAHCNYCSPRNCPSAGPQSIRTNLIMFKNDLNINFLEMTVLSRLNGKVLVPTHTFPSNVKNFSSLKRHIFSLEYTNLVSYSLNFPVNFIVPVIDLLDHTTKNYHLCCFYDWNSGDHDFVISLFLP